MDTTSRIKQTICSMEPQSIYSVQGKKFCREIHSKRSALPSRCFLISSIYLNEPQKKKQHTCTVEVWARRPLPCSELNLSRVSRDSKLRGKKNKIQQCTHNEAIVASILTVEEAIAGLEEEQACLSMVVIGGDTKCSQTFTLSQQLLLSRVGPLMWCSLREPTGNTEDN